MERSTTRAAAALGLALLLGCTTELRTGASEAASVIGVPSRVPAEVTLLARRAGFLDARVDTRRSELRFYFPVSEACMAVVTGDGPAEYASTGPYGRLFRGDLSCDPVGLLNLRVWRDRRPRQTTRTSSIVPRDTARYEVVYVDEEVFIARGRFQLAALVGWVGGFDTLAIFPNAPECDALLERGVATMEYRDAGPEPMILINKRQRCPFLGFAMSYPESGLP